MAGFGFTVLGFGSTATHGPAALSISLDKANHNPLELVDAAANHPLTSNAGQIDITATAAGGDGSYTFAWTLVEEGDDDNTATGILKVAAVGTTNAAQYNTLTLVGDSSSTVGQPFDITYRITCTVTDGNSDTAAITINQPVQVVAL